MVGTNILIRGGIRRLLMHFMLRRVRDFERVFDVKDDEGDRKEHRYSEDEQWGSG